MKTLGNFESRRKSTIQYFGDYILLGAIAEGSTGIVFNGRQVSSNRRVAIKILRTEQAAAVSHGDGGRIGPGTP